MASVSEEHLTQYRYLDNAASDSTIDSPFFSLFGELTRLMSEESVRIEKARRQHSEIEHKKIPVEGTSWVTLETTHPTEDVMEIYIALESQASEGLACAIIIGLSNVLKEISKSFNGPKTHFWICDGGSKIGSSYWAQAIIAASNYVRHRDEWVEKSSGGLRPERRDQKENVDVLQGAEIEGVWDGKPTLLDLVKHLEIDRWETLFERISSWLIECLPYHPGHSGKP